MVIARLCLWLYLGDVGTAFIIYIRDYSELLMNAVALAFILKLPELLYILLVPDHVKDKLMNAKSAPFPTSLPTSKWGRFWFSPMAWGLVVIPISVAVVVWYNLAFNTMPFLDALRCACYQEGSA